MSVQKIFVDGVGKVRVSPTVIDYTEHPRLAVVTMVTSSKITYEYVDFDNPYISIVDSTTGKRRLLFVEDGVALWSRDDLVGRMMQFEDETGLDVISDKDMLHAFLRDNAKAADDYERAVKFKQEQTKRKEIHMSVFVTYEQLPEISNVSRYVNDDFSQSGESTQSGSEKPQTRSISASIAFHQQQNAQRLAEEAGLVEASVSRPVFVQRPVITLIRDQSDPALL